MSAIFIISLTIGFTIVFIITWNSLWDALIGIEDRVRSAFRHIFNVEQSALELKNQVDHLATVQMLILKDLGKEHRVEPARNVLVSIGNLSDLKKPKGRSA